MFNLRTVLADDIAAGITAAQKAGDLPATQQAALVVVKPAENVEYGDYASPIALALTKEMKQPPLDIVEAIVKHMPKKEYVGKIEAVAPGFLNIRLNPGWMTARLDDVIEQELCADVTIGAGKSANLEFISANPTGPMTLGNARTAFAADTLANVLGCAGYNVTREYYINDAGAQVRKLGESVLRRILQARPFDPAQGKGEEIEFPEELYQGEYIKDIAATIAEQWAETEGKEFEAADLANAATISAIAQAAVRLNMTTIQRIVQDDMRIKFDVWTSEQKLRESGIVEETLEKLRKLGETYLKDGTEYLKTTAHGDTEDRVLVKKDGEYAYIAPDIAYHQHKYDRKFDLIFTFVGADHLGHVPKVKAAMQALGNDVSRLHFPVAQWVSFVRGKEKVSFSKRRGNIVTPQDLIKEVGYDVARFFMLQHALSSHMEFDLDLAKEQSDRNPVYYVQYAYVRLQSILRRAKEEGVLAEVGVKLDLSSRSSLTHTTELELMRNIYKWPELVEEIAANFAVHQLTYYAHELARSIHVFYKHVPVLAAEDGELVRSRLQLVVAARSVLGRTLDLLGISKPDVM